MFQRVTASAEATNELSDADAAAADDLQDDWAAAVDARYGSTSHGRDAAASSKSSSSGAKPNRSQVGSDGASMTEAEELGFFRSVSNRSLQNVASDCEMPIRSWVDPSNQRVLSEFSNGRRIAIGILHCSN